MEQLKASKGPVKNKNAKAPSSKGIHASSVKKNKDGKEVASAASNGSFTLDSHPKQPTKNKSSSDKQARLSKVNFVVIFVAYEILHRCSGIQMVLLHWFLLLSFWLCNKNYSFGIP